MLTGNHTPFSRSTTFPLPINKASYVIIFHIIYPPNIHIIYTPTTTNTIHYRTPSSAGDDDRSISSNNYQLANGACADSMTSDNFKNLIDIPLSPLVEDYYQW